MHLKTPESKASRWESFSVAGSKLFLGRVRVTYNRQGVGPVQFSTRLAVNNSCPLIDNPKRRPSTTFLRRRHQY